MIEPFPEGWELVELLGDPAVADSDVPWTYNRLTFETEVGEDRIRVELERASGLVQIEWQRDGRNLLTLSVADVASLVIRRERGTESLVIAQHAPSEMELALQVSPFVELTVISGMRGQR